MPDNEREYDPAAHHKKDGVPQKKKINGGGSKIICKNSPETQEKCVLINPAFSCMSKRYLFAEAEEKTKFYQRTHPHEITIPLGIGDVTLPLPDCVTDALKNAAEEMGKTDTFRGYPPTNGYSFLREALSGYYRLRGAVVSPEDIFISDGAKTDIGLLPLLFGDVPMIFPTPGYPAPRDACRIHGKNALILRVTDEESFCPSPDNLPLTPAVVWLCSPANPTGTAIPRSLLSEWVRWANETGSVILFDAAYESFAGGTDVPRSLYEIGGSETCGIEIGSFSKGAGMTGIRCGWTVVPESLQRGGVSLKEKWARLRAVFSNGVSYPTQRAAEAALSVAGLRAQRDHIARYLECASLLSEALSDAGCSWWGGKVSPYLWVKCPNGWGSEDFSLYLLEKHGIISTPGNGFGEGGDGFIRLSSFAGRDAVLLGAERIRAAIKSIS